MVTLQKSIANRVASGDRTVAVRLFGFELPACPAWVKTPPSLKSGFLTIRHSAGLISFSNISFEELRADLLPCCRVGSVYRSGRERRAATVAFGNGKDSVVSAHVRYLSAGRYSGQRGRTSGLW